MSNNKQTFNHNPNQSSVDWVIGEILKHEMAFFGTASIPLYIIEQAKAMHHKEVVDFVEDWYCNGPLLGGGVDVVATIEEHYNETYGGNNEQQ